VLNTSMARIPKDKFALTGTPNRREYSNDDRMDNYDMNVDPRPVYLCVEHRCRDEAPHAHAKRPYIVWRKG